MNLLAGTYYDPAAAVTKATTALLAMTALDTTNLRLTFTAPPSGRVLVRARGGCVHGATTFPQILVGRLESSPAAGTVRGRQVSNGGGFNGTAVASTQLPVNVEYVITGLTPGTQYVWDLAYGVEVTVASTGWKYGGPNNTTTNDAFGGISFEVWDPSPIYTPASGAAPTSTVHQKLPAALVGGRMDASVGAMAADTLTAAALAADAVTEIQSGLATAAALATVDDFVDTEVAAIKAVTDKLDTALEVDGAVYRFTVNALELAPGGDPWATAVPGAYGAGTAGFILGNRLDATVSSRSPSATALSTADWTAGRAAKLDNLDAAISSRSTYAGADTAGTTTLLSRLTVGRAANLDQLDAAITSRLAAGAYAAPDNASIIAIKAKTDELSFTAAARLDVNVRAVNGIAVGGLGTAQSPWGPA